MRKRSNVASSLSCSSSSVVKPRSSCSFFSCCFSNSPLVNVLDSFPAPVTVPVVVSSVDLLVVPTVSVSALLVSSVLEVVGSTDSPTPVSVRDWSIVDSSIPPCATKLASRASISALSFTCAPFLLSIHFLPFLVPTVAISFARSSYFAFNTSNSGLDTDGVSIVSSALASVVVVPNG